MKIHRITALAGILLIMLASCGPSPDLQPIVPSLEPVPASTSTSEPIRLWMDAAVPDSLRESALEWGIPFTDDSSASIRLEVSKSSSEVKWIYALVAPFPTVTDGVTSDELRAAWNASSSGSFDGSPLLMEESTLAALTALWGEPASGAIRTVPADQLLDAAWAERPSWAIIPFESIQPRWKVLTVDGQSPIRKDFDPSGYPLQAGFSLIKPPDANLANVTLPSTNRDPSKLTTVILTGVTALARATAATMDAKGVLYPGEEVRGLLREADITHINNEVPFYGGCPAPDPNQGQEVFCSAPRYIELLTDVGADIVELSGDHFADYGEGAMFETLDIYDKFGILYYGGGRNLEDGRKPLPLEVNGNKIVFIGCNYKTVYASATETVPGAVPCDFDYMTEQIGLYSAQGYSVISTFQYHEFDSPEARPQQMIDFRRMADAGAVIVSGSQAHVPQVMEFYNDSFIHYGLGNLFFDQMHKAQRREFIDRHVFYDGRYLGVELITTYLVDFSRPRMMTLEERARFLTEYFEASGW